MTYDEFNNFCRTLDATSYVMQWGGAHVWKVGGKVFAVGGWNDGEPAFTFKVADEAFETLQREPGLRPAPYFASRGMKWIQHVDQHKVSDEELRGHLVKSHQIVSLGLTQKMQRELGLNQL